MRVAHSTLIHHVNNFFLVPVRRLFRRSFHKDHDSAFAEGELDPLQGVSFDAFSRNHANEFIAFNQINDHLRASKEFLVHIDLWEGRPVWVMLEPFFNSRVSEDVNGFVFDFHFHHVLDEDFWRFTLWKVWWTSHKNHNRKLLQHSVYLLESKFSFFYELLAVIPIIGSDNLQKSWSLGMMDLFSFILIWLSYLIHNFHDLHGAK